MENKNSIGLIDSGIGGFTVLKELQNTLPLENAIYLGDSKRMPYGEKENEEIIALANSDIRFLEEQGVKAILLACNTVSSLIKKLTANVPLYSIVEAGCLATLDLKPKGEVGLIATRATVNNEAYPKAMANLSQNVKFVSQGTRTLASVINDYPEELELLRTHIHLAIDPLIEEREIYTLLLGCTHFPIVKETIEKLYPQLAIINPATKQIQILAKDLEKQGTLNKGKTLGNTKIYTTGNKDDYKIFETMIGYLGLRCQKLSRCILDIDKKREV